MTLLWRSTYQSVLRFIKWKQKHFWTKKKTIKVYRRDLSEPSLYESNDFFFEKLNGEILTLRAIYFCLYANLIRIFSFENSEFHVNMQCVTSPLQILFMWHSYHTAHIVSYNFNINKSCMSSFLEQP